MNSSADIVKPVRGLKLPVTLLRRLVTRMKRECWKSVPVVVFNTRLSYALHIPRSFTEFI